jgi:hypothetical protein
MKITTEWLREQKACDDGIVWFEAQFESQAEADGIKVVEKLIAEQHLGWANWLIVRIMNYRQYVSYAVYAADQILGNFESRHPGDDWARKAIDAARKCIADPSAENKLASADAAADAAPVDAAYDDAYAEAYVEGASADAADAALAAQAAASAAARAAAYDDAASAAAAYVANADAYVVANAYAAAVNAALVGESVLIKILTYGIELFGKAGEEVVF